MSETKSEQKSIKEQALEALSSGDFALAKDLVLKCDEKQKIAIFHEVCRNELLEAIKFLVNDAGIDPSCVQGMFKDTPLHNACSLGHLSVAKLLMTFDGVDCTNLNKAKRTPLHSAASRGRVDVVKYLVESAGADVNAAEKAKHTPLSLATIEESPETIKYLLSCDGIDPNCRHKFQMTPLHWSATGASTEIPKMLLADPRVEAQCQNKDGRTPMHLSMKKDNVEMVKVFLASKGADINFPDKIGYTSLLMAAQRGHAEIVKFLISQGADVNCRTQRQETPLLLSIISQNIEMVKLFLEVGEVDVDCKEEDGVTPVILATVGGQTETVKLLLERGCDLSLRDEEGTVLHHACVGGYAEIVRELLKHGADANDKNKNGKTALQIAAQYRRAPVVDIFLSREYPSAKDKDKEIRSIYDQTADLGVHEVLIRHMKKLHQSLVPKIADLLTAANVSSITASNIAQLFELQRDETHFLEYASLKDVTLLGAGNFGEAFTASMDLANEEKIETVCKVAKQGAGKEEWNELRILRCIPRHPNVLRLLGLCTDWDNGHAVALVTEFHRRGELKKLIDKGVYKDDMIGMLRLALQMTAAVMHLHQNSVLHRDIACRNFVVSNAGAAVLIDFGMAVKAEDCPIEAGLPYPFRWMPLESFTGTAADRKSTKKGDVYALGVSFWEFFNRRGIPFRACKSIPQYSARLRKTLDEAAEQRSTAYAPLVGLDRIPEPFSTLIKEICVIDAEKRPNAKEVYDKISALLQKKEKELADSKELRAKQEALANNADTTNDTEEKSNEGDDSDDSDIDLYEAAAEGSDSDADEGSYATYDAADDI